MERLEGSSLSAKDLMHDRYLELRSGVLGETFNGDATILVVKWEFERLRVRKAFRNLRSEWCVPPNGADACVLSILGRPVSAGWQSSNLLTFGSLALPSNFRTVSFMVFVFTHLPGQKLVKARTLGSLHSGTQSAFPNI